MRLVYEEPDWPHVEVRFRLVRSAIVSGGERQDVMTSELKVGAGADQSVVKAMRQRVRAELRGGKIDVVYRAVIASDWRQQYGVWDKGEGSPCGTETHTFQ